MSRPCVREPGYARKDTSLSGIFIFGEHQILWECDHHKACETYPKLIGFGHVGLNSMLDDPYNT